MLFYTSFPNTMRFLELCTLTDSQIADLLGLMKEWNAELTVSPVMWRRAVGRQERGSSSQRTKTSGLSDAPPCVFLSRLRSLASCSGRRMYL